jgi:CDGSH-type Zn-finger protein
MARFVRKEDRDPMEVKVGNESKWICMCRLSNYQPFCDGSQMKKQVKSIDITHMELGSRSNKNNTLISIV